MFVTRHEEYLGGWVLQAGMVFPDSVFFPRLQPKCSGKAHEKVSNCVPEMVMLVPLLVMPCLCSTLLLGIKIRFFGYVGISAGGCCPMIQDYSNE